MLAVHYLDSSDGHHFCHSNMHFVTTNKFAYKKAKKTLNGNCSYAYPEHYNRDERGYQQWAPNPVPPIGADDYTLAVQAGQRHPLFQYLLNLLFMCRLSVDANDRLRAGEPDQEPPSEPISGFSITGI